MRRGALVFAVCGLWLGVLPVAASGLDVPEPAFWWDRTPTDPSAFIDGRLGILTPRLRSELRPLAYRHLAGLGLSPEARAEWVELLGLERSMQGPGSSGLARWLAARAEVPGATPLSWISTGASLETADQTSTRLQFFENCLDDAFASATARLEAMQAALPAELGSWLESQDLVFANCSSLDAGVPEALPASAPSLARQERAYQRAAALFYATRFGDAIEAFEEIAASDSPHRSLAALAVARARLRQAVLERMDLDRGLTLARDELERILGDASHASIHPSARRLLRYVRLRLTPDRMLAERVGGALGRGEALDPEGVRELLWLLERRRPSVGEQSVADPAIDDFIAWWAAWHVQPGDAEARQVVDRWRQSRGHHWLLAALWVTRAEDPWAAELLEHLESQESAWRGTAAGDSLEYQRARLLIAVGSPEVAAALLDRAIAADPTPSDRNRWLDLRASAAPDLVEAAWRGQLVPLGLRWGGMSQIESLGDLPRGYDIGRDGRLWTDALGERLDRGLPPSGLLAIAKDSRIADTLRRRAANAGWTRVALLGDSDVARALTAELASLAPELADDLASYQSAETPEARRFAAALAMLRFPGLGPRVRSGLGRAAPIAERPALRDNGWCSGSWPREPGGNLAAPTATDAPVPAAAEQGSIDLRAAPVELGEIVLAWVSAHPDDPRAPESLHRVVAATRYGCSESERNGEISRAAFTALHRRFPDSEWTRRTPYWFGY